MVNNLFQLKIVVLAFFSKTIYLDNSNVDIRSQQGIT